MQIAAVVAHVAAEMTILQAEAPENRVQDDFPSARVSVLCEVQDQAYLQVTTGALHTLPHLRKKGRA